MIIDSHCHVSPDWYEPVESLLHQMDRHGVGRAVLVQRLGQMDNRYQQDCVRRHPDRFSSVVLVDPAAPDACEDLRRLAEQGVSGLRLRPTARSPGEDALAIWRQAASSGLVISCVGSTASFAAPAFGAVLDALPALPIVLEHLGGESRPDANETEQQARRRVFAYAGYPNLHLKLPGLAELAVRSTSTLPGAVPFDPNPPAVLREALDHFGPSRLLWGSDFPPVSSREGYGNALAWPRLALSDLPSADRALIFGGNAARLFWTASL